MRTFVYILAWLGLAALAVAAAIQLHITFIFLMALIIENPNLGSVYWTSRSLATWSRFSIFVFGSLWLIYVMALEHILSTASQENRLWPSIVRMVLILGSVIGICDLLQVIL